MLTFLLHLFLVLRPSLSCFPTGDNGFITTTTTLATTTTITTTTPTTTTTSPPKPCSLCQEQWLFIDPENSDAGEKDFNSATIFFENDECVFLELVCTGEMATVEFNLGANGVIADLTEVVTELECNEEGTGWVLPGDNILIEDMSCATTDRFIVTPDCKTCRAGLIDTTPEPGLNEKEFDEDIINPTQGCTERILTCRGPGATIEFNRGMGIVIRPPGAITVSARLFCNAAGTGWYFDTKDPSMIITAATCATA